MLNNHNNAKEILLTSTLKEQELLSLVGLCKLIVSAIACDELLNIIIFKSLQMLKAEGSSIILLSEDKKELIFCYVAGDKKDNIQKIHLTYGEGIVGWVIDKNESVIVNNPKDDQRFCGRVDGKTSFQTRNVLCVPMKIEDKVIGALEVVNKQNNENFTFYDLKICEAISSLGGIAIEKSQLVEKIIKSERLAGIGQAVAGLAHCVKNILNGLKGGEYLVNRGLKKNDFASLNSGWETVQKNIQKISTLVLDMLSYVKDREPEYSEVNPNNIIEEVKTLLEIQASNVRVKIETKIDENLAKSQIDPKGIYRCLVNLVGNAIDACSVNGGVVTITSCLVEDNHFIIDVSDTGTGMDENTLNNLFTNFFSTKGSKGTGLGLPVTQKIIKEHKGSLTVKSTQGRGTTCTIRLPLFILSN